MPSVKKPFEVTPRDLGFSVGQQVGSIDPAVLTVFRSSFAETVSSEVLQHPSVSGVISERRDFDPRLNLTLIENNDFLNGLLKGIEVSARNGGQL